MFYCSICNRLYKDVQEAINCCMEKLNGKEKKKNELKTKSKKS